jgi:hypothetical protein
MGKCPAGLSCYIIVVSEVLGAPFRGRRKLRGVVTDGGDSVARLTNVIGMPHPWWSMLLLT